MSNTRKARPSEEREHRNQSEADADMQELNTGHVVVNTRGPPDGRFTFTSHDPGTSIHKRHLRLPQLLIKTRNQENKLINYTQEIIISVSIPTLRAVGFLHNISNYT